MQKCPVCNNYLKCEIAYHFGQPFVTYKCTCGYSNNINKGICSDKTVLKRNQSFKGGDKIMKSPCYLCHIRGKEYSPENCKECDFEIVASKYKKLVSYIENYADEIIDPNSVLYICDDIERASKSNCLDNILDFIEEEC